MNTLTNKIDTLRSQVTGKVILPGDPDYDGARQLFYGWVQKHPGAIVKVANVDDVIAVVNFSRQYGIELAVRSGGHSAAGHSLSEGGLVLDLSQMQKIEVDTKARTAWVETGATAGMLTNAASEHGLVIGFGDTGTVGVGGITLGGGVGYLARKYGLAIDSLLAAEVVTADGRLVRTDAENHPDLFWALRGGGGNFGVAVRFQFKLQELAEGYGGMLILPATAEVLAGFMEAAEAAPDELSGIANAMPAPPMPFLPAELHGKLIIFAMLFYAGDPKAGEQAIAPILKLATPLANMLAPMKYAQLFEGGDGPHPVAGASQNMHMVSVDKKMAQTILDRLNASSAPLRVVQLRPLGGAMARVHPLETAYAHRKSKIMANVACLYENLDEADIHARWVRETVEALDQGDRAVYVNFLGDEGAERVRAAYPGLTGQRLAEIKRRYDPENLFRLNQNIFAGERITMATKKTTAKPKTPPIKDPSVKAYMASAKPDQRAALNKLRGQILQACPDAVELRAYGIAGFKYKGKPLMYYGHNKNHIGIYGSVPPEFKKDLAAFDVEKGTIRFQPEKPVPATLVKRMVKARMAKIEGKS